MADMELNTGLEELGAELGEEFGAEFQIEEIKDEVALSDDTEGFAKAFPKWDLHPPMEKK